MVTIVSRDVLAQKLGVTRSTISDYAKRGMPHMLGIGVDLDEAMAWVEANTTSRSKTGPKPDNIGVNREDLLDPAQERARRDREAGIKLSLDNDRKLRRTCEISVVESSVAPFISMIRNRVLGLGAELAPLLTVVTDPEEIKSIIDARTHKLLTELSSHDIGRIVRRNAASAARQDPDGEDED